MAIKAKRLKTKKGLKQSLSGGNSKFAQRVPEEGIVVRFLTEPEEWWEVELHYGDKTSFPCNGDDGCLGCDEGYDTGRKWYANVFLPDDDRVAVFEMGKSVVEAVSKKYDRNHTVMDRDFEITKEGAGMRTKYDVEALDVRHIKGLDSMTLVEMDTFFEEWLKRAMREEAGEEEVSSVGRRRTKASSSRRRAAVEEDDIEDDDDDDDENDVEEEAPVKKTTTAKKRPTARRRVRR